MFEFRVKIEGYPRLTSLFHRRNQCERKAAFAFLLVLFVALFGCAPREAPKTGEKKTGSATEAPDASVAGSASTHEAVVHINNENEFKKHVLEAELPCLADFFSDSCPPCRKLAPTMEALAQEYEGRAIVCKVSLDHDEMHGLARQYKIMGIPAVLFFEHGQERQRLVGLRSKINYSAVLDEMIDRHNVRSSTN